MIEIFDPPKASGPGIVLVTEGDYFPVLMNMLSQARRSVDVLGFAFVVGGGGTLYYKSLPFQVMGALKAAAAKRRRVRVRVFLEGARATAAANAFTVEHLQRGGVEARLGPTHVKAVIVDGRYTLMGSTNLTEPSLSKNFETNILLDSAAIAGQAQKYFDHSWVGGACGGITLRAPLLADGAFKDRIVSGINKAKRTIAFSIYFFKQLDIERALGAANRRGVKITGLVHTHRRLGLDDVRRTRATVERLREAGLSDLTFADPVRFTHSKYIVIDRETVLLGSGNWLDRDVTVHPQLYVVLKDKRVGRALAEHLASQISARRERF